MKSSLLLIAIGSALTATAKAAPEQLSLIALDEAVAGSEKIESNEAETAQPGIVVADRSQVELKLRRNIALTEESQQGAKAMNLVNAASADVASGVNTAVGSSDGMTAQSNSVWQTQSGVAAAASIERRGRNIRTETMEARDTLSSSSSFASNESIIRTRSHRSVVDTYNAQVPGYFPLQNLTFSFETPKLPSVTVPSFGFDFTYTDDVGGVYGIRGGLGPFHFDPPQLSLGSISLSGNDLVLRGGYVQLPSLDLGEATIDVCVVTCGGVALDLPTIDGPRIDFGAEYRLAGANPFKDVRVNAGGGFAGAGQGHLAVSLGSVRVGAEVSLDLPDLTTSFSFNVLDQQVSTGNFGVEIPAISASINLIDADVGVAYSADFNGALCISIVTTTCDGLRHREQNENTKVEIERHSERSAQSTTGSGSKHGESSETIGASMIGAEGNLIAMGDGAASVDTESVVGMNAQAQKGLNVLNVVNATGAMIGNAANVAAQRPNTTNGALSQSNVFNQFQTRPRGR